MGGVYDELFDDGIDDDEDRSEFDDADDIHNGDIEDFDIDDLPE